MDLGNFAQLASCAVALLALYVSIITARNKGIKEAIDGLRGIIEGKASKGEAEDLFGRMHKVEATVARVETEVAHLPGKDTAHRLELAIMKLDGRLEAMNERLTPVAAMATRMQEAMIMEHSK